MTQEHKDLLLKDLCARLPYGVKCSHKNEGIFSLTCIDLEYNYIYVKHGGFKIGEPEINHKHIKPYLFPLSSITEEQKNELREMEWSFDNSTICNIIECFGTYRAYVDHSCCSELIDWFIKNHIDYRGLIPMGLANDATGKNIY